MKRLLPYGFSLALLLVGCDQMMSRDGTSTMPSSAPVDNTAVNKRDANADVKTPIDQDETPADVKRTAEIRQRVVKHDGLSVNAQNVKIITSGGKVTLRGPVKSDAERDTVGQIAVDVAGAENVDNQLDVPAATPRLRTIDRVCA